MMMKENSMADCKAPQVDDWQGRGRHEDAAKRRAREHHYGG
jgi:hypothetical protein